MGNKPGKSPSFRADTDDVGSDMRVGEALQKVPLLSSYSAEELGKLGAVLKQQSYEPGDVILKQGDPGEGFFIIQDGDVVVMVKTPAGAETELGRLGAGDYFGETALINNKPRGATVTAVTKVNTFFLLREHFKKLFNAETLNVKFAKREAVSAETKSSAVAPAVPEGARNKTPEELASIQKAVQSNLLFAGLQANVQEKVIAEMYKQDVAAGTALIKQGDKGDLFFVVASGSFDIFVDDNKVASRGAGECFGELALMYNAPRAATVSASRASVVWVVHRATFRRVVMDVSSNHFSNLETFLKKVPLLAPLASYERAKIAEALEEVKFEAGKVIFKQGDEGMAMYIVLSGEAAASKDGETLMSYKAGDFFGERALMKREPRAATMTATTACTLLELDKSSFEVLLGPVEDILQQTVQSYDSAGSGGGKIASREKAEVKQQEAAELKGENIPFESLRVLGTLGKGSFGHVQLVQSKDTSTTYALKAVSKAMIVETGQQGHIMSEKDVMARLKHPFLIRLHQTYKDRDRLYFLLEPVLGGELFTVLRTQTLFDERTSRFYAACVLMAFEYMHSFDIVYRDLKPENLLIDEKGYIKITDFGFAKCIQSGRTWTLCGTPDYLAPEIVAGKGHGKGVDWWTLGILIYEMLASYPPFYDDDPMKTYQKIMTGDIAYPNHFSKPAISLIKKLLYRRATRRLGVVKGGASLIKKHMWFDDFNKATADGETEWDELYKKNLAAPMIPKIQSHTDLSNFEEVEEGDDVMPYQDDGSAWDADF